MSEAKAETERTRTHRTWPRAQGRQMCEIRAEIIPIDHLTLSCCRTFQLYVVGRSSCLCTRSCCSSVIELRKSAVGLLYVSCSGFYLSILHTISCCPASIGVVSRCGVSIPGSSGLQTCKSAPARTGR